MGIGRAKWASWEEYLVFWCVVPVYFACQSEHPLWILLNGNKCTEPWFSSVNLARSKFRLFHLGMTHFIYYSLTAFYSCFFHILISVHLLLRKKNLQCFTRYGFFCNFPIAEMDVQCTQENPLERDTNYYSSNVIAPEKWKIEMETNCVSDHLRM